MAVSSCGHFLTARLLSTFDIPPANPSHTPPPPQLPWALPQPSPPRPGPSRHAGLHGLHLTLPAQHCLLWPLWECRAICWSQTFYEHEDRKKFFSIDRSQACSLPLLFISLFGDEREGGGQSQKAALSAEPLKSSPVSGPLPPLCQVSGPEQLLLAEGPADLDLDAQDLRPSVPRDRHPLRSHLV